MQSVRRSAKRILRRAVKAMKSLAILSKRDRYLRLAFSFGLGLGLATAVVLSQSRGTASILLMFGLSLIALCVIPIFTIRKKLRSPTDEFGVPLKEDYKSSQDDTGRTRGLALLVSFELISFFGLGLLGSAVIVFFFRSALWGR